MSSSVSSSASARFRIVIGQKSYSSWSFRGWLPVRHLVSLKLIPSFEEINIRLAGAGAEEGVRFERKKEILQFSPSGRVPALLDSSINHTVHDSLAILLYLSEQFPSASFFPPSSSPVARALAMSLCAEMHSGLFGIRSNWPMNVMIIATSHGKKTYNDSIELREDIDRLNEIFSTTRENYGLKNNEGPYLFGKWSGVDIMFAPVAMRFRSYDPQLNFLKSSIAKDYIRSVWEREDINEWIAAAQKEGPDTKIAAYEIPNEKK